MSGEQIGSDDKIRGVSECVDTGRLNSLNRTQPDPKVAIGPCRVPALAKSGRKGPQMLPRTKSESWREST